MIRNRLVEPRAAVRLGNISYRAIAIAALALAPTACGDRPIFRPLPDVPVAVDAIDARADVSLDARPDAVIIDAALDAPDDRATDAGVDGGLLPDQIDVPIIDAGVDVATTETAVDVGTDTPDVTDASLPVDEGVDAGDTGVD